jgi:hypothetical protein
MAMAEFLGTMLDKISCCPDKRVYESFFVSPLTKVPSPALLAAAVIGEIMSGDPGAHIIVIDNK